MFLYRGIGSNIGSNIGYMFLYKGVYFGIYFLEPILWYPVVDYPFTRFYLSLYYPF